MSLCSRPPTTKELSSGNTFATRAYWTTPLWKKRKQPTRILRQFVSNTPIQKSMHQSQVPIKCSLIKTAPKKQRPLLQISWSSRNLAQQLCLINLKSSHFMHSSKFMFNTQHQNMFSALRRWSYCRKTRQLCCRYRLLEFFGTSLSDQCWIVISRWKCKRFGEFSSLSVQVWNNLITYFETLYSSFLNFKVNSAGKWFQPWVNHWPCLLQVHPSKLLWRPCKTLPFTW